MLPRAMLLRRRVPGGTQSNSERSLLTFPPPEIQKAGGNLVRRPGGLIKAPRNLAAAPGKQSRLRLTKLLLNVTIERSLGPVQVVISSEKTVGDLVKAAVEIYVGEKRRPLLPDPDPHRFELHYSRYSLESLKVEEKLINLGSRNFFMCSKPVKSSCSEEAKKDANSLFPWTKLMDFLL